MTVTALDEKISTSIYKMITFIFKICKEKDQGQCKKNLIVNIKINDLGGVTPGYFFLPFAFSKFSLMITDCFNNKHNLRA